MASIIKDDINISSYLKQVVMTLLWNVEFLDEDEKRRTLKFKKLKKCSKLKKS